MNLTEKLLKIDLKKFNEIVEKKYKSKILSEIAGEDIYLTLKATDSNRLLELSKQASSDDTVKQMEAIKIICSLGIVDPDLKSTDLKVKFGLNEKDTPVSLIDKIWGVRQLELIDIAKEILYLNGLSTSEDTISN